MEKNLSYLYIYQRGNNTYQKKFQKYNFENITLKTNNCIVSFANRHANNKDKHKEIVILQSDLLRM